jgi:hypothetical protein
MSAIPFDGEFDELDDSLIEARDAANAKAKSKARAEKRIPQADKLIALSSAAKLFHTSDGNCYADIEINGHRETWPVRSKGFRRWLMRRYFEEERGAPNSEAISTSLGMIEAHAHFNSPERVVCVRVGGMDGKLYLDLCGADWRAVEIDATGWRVIDNPPVRFRRSAGMQPLPLPKAGGTVRTLKSFLNVKSDEDFVLVVAWLLAAFRDRGPYPVLAVAGEQGSAKSTFSAILRSLIDPNTAPLRALPREDRDLFIAATNGHLLAFDNVSGLPAWISDTLCRLASGGGFATRTLYSDQDETLFDASRPIILNGIEDIVTKPDLGERSLLLTLQSISEDMRRTEKELWGAFEAQRPFILGALLTAVSNGLERLPEIKLAKSPRMADFALWATACETAIWPSGTFLAAYAGNVAEATDNMIDADPVAVAVRELMAAQTEWTGTASELLNVLAGMVGERVAKAKGWPEGPRALSGRLRRSAPVLRKRGIEIRFPTGHHYGRVISILRGVPKVGDFASRPSRPSPPEQNGKQINGLTPETMAPPTVPVSSPTVPAASYRPRCVPNKTLKNKELGRGDDGDAKNPTLGNGDTLDPDEVRI